MIIYDNFLIVTPPRVASVALNYFFTERGGEIIVDAAPYFWHQSIIPAEHADKTALFIVRHPVARLQSLYRCFAETYNEDFATWIARLINGGLTDHDKNFERNLSSFYADCPNAIPIKMEELDAGLAAQGLPNGVPLQSYSVFENGVPVVTEPPDIATAWINEDMTAFGY